MSTKVLKIVAAVLALQVVAVLAFVLPAHSPEPHGVPLGVVGPRGGRRAGREGAPRRVRGPSLHLGGGRRGRHPRPRGLRRARRLRTPAADRVGREPGRRPGAPAGPRRARAGARRRRDRPRRPPRRDAQRPVPAADHRLAARGARARAPAAPTYRARSGRCGARGRRRAPRRRARRARAGPAPRPVPRAVGRRRADHPRDGAARRGAGAADRPGGLGIAAATFLLIGNPGSGNGSAPELLPGFWRAVGPLLPPGAGGTALRNVAYFDGAALGRPLLVLLAFVAAGGALLAVSGRAASAAPSASRRASRAPRSARPVADAG